MQCAIMVQSILQYNRITSSRNKVKFKMIRCKIFQIILLPMALGCTNSTPAIDNSCNGQQPSITSYVPLYETAYITDLADLISKSNSMLSTKNFPFFYTLEDTDAIGLYCTSNDKERKILQLITFGQSYLAELYRVGVNGSNFFVALVTEDITDCYYCIVVPEENDSTYISDIFFFDDEMGILKDISLSDDNSLIQFIHYKNDSKDSIVPLNVSLNVCKTDIVFE